MNTIGQQIKDLRRINKYRKPADLANKCHSLNANRLIVIEAGYRDATLEQLSEIAYACGVTTQHFNLTELSA